MQDLKSPENWYDKIWIRNLAIGSAVALIGCGIVLAVLAFQSDPLRIAARDVSEIFRNLLLGLFGLIGGVIGLWLAYSRTIAAKRSSEAALLAAKTTQEKEEREKKFNQEKQVTENFTRAIEQLGHADMSVRLGALHGLARILKQSPEEQWPIISVICAHIRAQSKLEVVSPDAANQVLAKPSKSTNLSEIQLSIDIISSRDVKFDPPNSNIFFNDCDFRGIVFRASKLDRARISNCRFDYAHFIEGSFDGAFLQRSQFPNAVFDGPSLNSVVSEDCNFWRANFSRVSAVSFSSFDSNFKAAHFSESVLQSAELGILEKVSFIKCDLSFATFMPSSFKGCRFQFSKLRSVKFGSAEVFKSLFWRCDLQESDLSGVLAVRTRFLSVDFTSANLKSTKMQNCGFAKADFSKEQRDQIEFVNCYADLNSGYNVTDLPKPPD